MRKIPTVFVRDHESGLRYVSREPHPDCGWVFDGEGQPTRKYDGTCVMFDGEKWWARREVKPGKATPANFVHVGHDETTGKTVGWEPVEQSSFAKYHAEALEYGVGIGHWERQAGPQKDQTYELVGPRVNGNPEHVDRHLLVDHGYMAAVDYDEMRSLPRDFDGIGKWLAAHPDWEGVVWHHPDGRMAKIKRKDFPS